MSRRAGAAVAVLVLSFAAGCATPTVYPNGIRHCYLCGVRVARVNGYEVREQDFHPNSGELVAARSMPDIRVTEVKRSWWKRTREVFKNLMEHGKFESWDADVASERVRTEERMTVKFSARATGPLGWLGVTRKDKTKVKVAADFTEYAREDWVIARRDLDPATHERLKRQLRDCLGLAAPTAYTRAAATVTPAPAVVAVVPASATPTAVAVTAVVPPSSTALVAAAPVSGTVVTAPGVVVGTAAPGTTVVASAAVTAPAPAPVVRVTKMSADRIAEILGKGKDAYEGGKFKEAIPLLEQAAAADPESAESLVYLGASYYQEKRLDDAIRTYESYLVLAPDDFMSKSVLEELRREKAGGP